MPRRARVLLPGGPLHLIQRGNNRSACFYSDADYLFYLQCLAEQADKHACAVQALDKSWSVPGSVTPCHGAVAMA